ncbi:MAG: AI-2E family transporter, partial [Acaryochloridaceae cyanobacterium RL_2_7]|nr:AI-2E family transporter [Acaryochloridaceae cyanobacterium RL_2_7]
MADRFFSSNQSASGLDSVASGMVTPVGNWNLGANFDAVITFVMTFYMLLYGNSMWNGVMKLVPKPYGQAVSSAIRYNFQR